MATASVLAAAVVGGAAVTGGGVARRVHVVAPFRAGADQPERAAQLKKFVARFSGWAAEPGRDVHIVEQCDDHRFNRGALLNAGFDLVEKGRAPGEAAGKTSGDTYVFHDVDLLPDPTLLAEYESPPPVHLAATWDRYSKDARGRTNLNYLGGALSLSGAQFRALGGYPNDFWGWGGEDDELRERLKAARLFAKVRRPARGAMADLENLTLAEKLAVLKAKDLKCPFKRERRDDHASRRWRNAAPRGLAEIGRLYTHAGSAELAPGVFLDRVCLRRAPPTFEVFSVEQPGAAGGDGSGSGEGGSGPGAPPPHADEYQRRLEGQIDVDLARFPARAGAYEKMRAFARGNDKYLRSCVFVEADAATVRCEAPNPDSPHWKEHMPDQRTLTYAFMIRELVGWCARHGLRFPEGRYAIYLTDTYAWESPDLPWMVVARPENRGGILVPDDSFVVHGGDGRAKPVQEGMIWAWDGLVAEAKALPATPKKPGVLFRGSNTGADKYATRLHLSRRKWKIPARVVLLGRSTPPRPFFEWGSRVLLNLPGHQPWSYRLKYLFLTRAAVFNVDVEVQYPRGETTRRWVQFCDRAFVAGDDYVRFTVADRDRAPARARRRAAEKLAGEIEAAYEGLGGDRFRRMTASAFRKATELSSSRILQYLYRVFAKY